MRATKAPVLLNLAFPTMEPDPCAHGDQVDDAAAGADAAGAVPAPVPVAPPAPPAPTPTAAAPAIPQTLVGVSLSELQDTAATIKTLLIIIACLVGTMVVGQLYTVVLSGARRRR
jgi:hypothetical protein